MKSLDGKKKLDETIYHEFFQNAGNEIDVFYGRTNNTDSLMKFKKSEFTDGFFAKKNLDVIPNNQDIVIIGGDVALTITKFDLLKYCEVHKTNHRKLVDAEQYLETPDVDEPNVKSNTVSYYRQISCAKCEKGKLINYSYATIITGPEDVLKQINFWLTKYFIETDEKKIRFNLKYKKGDEAYPYKWKSVDELVNEGTFLLES